MEVGGGVGRGWRGVMSVSGREQREKRDGGVIHAGYVDSVNLIEIGHGDREGVGAIFFHRDCSLLNPCVWLQRGSEGSWTHHPCIGDEEIDVACLLLDSLDSGE